MYMNICIYDLYDIPGRRTHYTGCSASQPSLFTGRASQHEVCG